MSVGPLGFYLGISSLTIAIARQWISLILSVTKRVQSRYENAGDSIVVLPFQD